MSALVGVSGSMDAVPGAAAAAAAVAPSHHHHHHHHAHDFSDGCLNLKSERRAHTTASKSSNQRSHKGLIDGSKLNVPHRCRIAVEGGAGQK